MNTHYRLARDAFGKLLFMSSDAPAEEVVPVRAFPIGARDENIALVNLAGHEVAWVERLADLSPDLQQLLREELASREFMPEIRRIVAVSSYATPTEWDVETDRGRTVLMLKSEHDIRRVSAATLVIADGNGLHFLIRDVAVLDRGSRKFLDRFL